MYKYIYIYIKRFAYIYIYVHPKRGTDPSTLYIFIPLKSSNLNLRPKSIKAHLHCDCLNSTLKGLKICALSPTPIDQRGLDTCSQIGTVEVVAYEPEAAHANTDISMIFAVMTAVIESNSNLRTNGHDL